MIDANAAAKFVGGNTGVEVSVILLAILLQMDLLEIDFVLYFEYLRLLRQDLRQNL